MSGQVQCDWLVKLDEILESAWKSREPCANRAPVPACHARKKNPPPSEKHLESMHIDGIRYLLNIFNKLK